MGEGITFLIGFPLVKWPVMVALLAALGFDAVRAAYTWPFIAIAGVLCLPVALALAFLLQPLSQSVSVVVPILFFALFLVLLIAFDAWVVGRQARRRFYRDTDDVLSWRAAWGVSLAGNLLPLLVIVVSVLLVSA